MLAAIVGVKTSLGFV
uniref:Uncharacterized protein n=1 Tax=Arundo donax TaxID=35708 RepID=A0A0A9FB63_ARUDO